MAEPYDLAGRIIGCAMKVHRALGPGFLESVYQKALAIELRRAGFKVELEKPIKVFYEGENIGDFLADMFVEETVVVENKAVQTLAKIHEVQLVNYLTATGMATGVLLNFGASSLQFKKKFRRAKKSSNSNDDPGDSPEF